MRARSLALSLRNRLDGTTLNSASNLHQKPKNLPTIGQKQRSRSIENGLEATSHQKMATYGASPESTPTHTACLNVSHHEVAQLARAGPTHPNTWLFGGGGGASGNREIARKPTEIGW